MLDNLRAYGLTRVTARYYGQQVMLAVSTLMLLGLVLITALTIVTGTFQLVPFWLGVGAVIVTERLVTVWRVGFRGRLLAAAVLPELSYDMSLQLAFLRACWLTATSRDAGWNHVHRERPATAHLRAVSAPSRFVSWDYSSRQTCRQRDGSSGRRSRGISW